MGYHKPGINDPDDAVYNAIASVLSAGRSARLYRSLVKEKKLAVNVMGASGMPGRKYPNLFVFYAMPAAGHTNDEVEKAIDEQVQKLTTEPVTKEELDGVKRRARAALARQTSDNMYLAMLLSDYAALTGDWRNLFRQPEKIDAVTPADILRVAKTIFTPDNKTVGTIEPAETAKAK